MLVNQVMDEWQETRTISAGTMARMLDRYKMLEVQLQTTQQQVDEWRQRALDYEKQLGETTSKLAELQAKMAFYESPHMPSSAPSIKSRRPARKKVGGKRGAPKGHPGATYEPGPPDEQVTVETPQCPECQRPSGEATGQEKRTITGIEHHKGVKVTEFRVLSYTCPNGHQYVGVHPECPQVGQYSPTLLATMAMLKYMLRGTYRKLSTFLQNVEGFSISPKGIMDAMRRVGRACQAEYGDIAARIRVAPWVQVDETSLPVLKKDKKWWLWVFRTPTDVLLVARPTRKRSVVDEVLGEDPPPLVADGAAMFKHARILQRCWSHLLREAEAEPELHARLLPVYRDLKKALKSNDMPERVRNKELLDGRLDEIAATSPPSKALTYLKGGMGSWNTCLLYPGMPPHNNGSEQALRESAVVRRIIGCYRSEEGAVEHQYLASLMATWTEAGLDPFEELLRVLQHRLCGVTPEGAPRTVAPSES